MDFFLSNNIYLWSAKNPGKKKKFEGEQTLEEFNSAHRRSQAKCQLIQTGKIKGIKLFLFAPYNKLLLTELSRSV